MAKPHVSFRCSKHGWRRRSRQREIETAVPNEGTNKSWRAISLGASVPRSRRRCRPQARRFNPGFYFGFGGFGKLLVVVEAGFWALAEAAGKIWRPTAVRTFFEGPGVYCS